MELCDNFFVDELIDRTTVDGLAEFPGPRCLIVVGHIYFYRERLIVLEAFDCFGGGPRSALVEDRDFRHLNPDASYRYARYLYAKLTQSQDRSYSSRKTLPQHTQ